MPNYIEKRRQRFYAVLDIPQDVRSKLGGKSRWLKSLQTGDRQQALRIAPFVIARWKGRIEEARGTDDVIVEARLWRDLLAAEADQEQRELIKFEVFDRAEDLWRKGAPRGEDDVETAKVESSTLHLAERFAGVAFGTKTPIQDHFEDFLRSRDVKEKTEGDHRRALSDLLRRHTIVEEIDRKAASSFVTDFLQKAKGLKAPTVNRRLNTYRQYWEWMVKRGHLPESRKNPWEGQWVKIKQKEVLERRAFTEQEGADFLRKLGERHNQYPDDQPIAMLQAVTGMRVEEAANLKGDSIEIDRQGIAWVTIEEGKTAAAARTIPVVDHAVVSELRKRQSDGYVFQRVGGKARENSRGDAFKKRASRVLDKINDSPEIVANHSWRYRAIKLLELADNSERYICDYFVGHAQKGESLTRYFTEGNRAKLVVAARAVTLPKGWFGDGR